MHIETYRHLQTRFNRFRYMHAVHTCIRIYTCACVYECLCPRVETSVRVHACVRRAYLFQLLERSFRVFVSSEGLVKSNLQKLVVCLVSSANTPKTSTTSGRKAFSERESSKQVPRYPSVFREASSPDFWTPCPGLHPARDTWERLSLCIYLFARFEWSV